MSYPIKRVPELQAILRAWTPFKELVGVTSVRTEADYAQACATIDVLIDEIGDDENHPLAEVRKRRVISGSLRYGAQEDTDE